MTITPRVRKFVFTAHVVCSVGWIGAVVAYLALVVAALTSDDAQTVRAAVLAMELTYFVLVPLAWLRSSVVCCSRSARCGAGPPLLG